MEEEAGPIKTYSIYYISIFLLHRILWAEQGSYQNTGSGRDSTVHGKRGMLRM